VREKTFVFVLKFASWPSNVRSPVFLREEDGWKCEVIANPGGFLSVVIVEDDIASEFTFTRLDFADSSAPLLMVVRLDQSGARLDINGQSIGPQSDPLRSDAVSLKAAGSSDPAFNALEEVPQIVVGVGSNLADAEQFFVRTVADLQMASRSNDAYTLIRASGVLRLLLLDGLLHKANARLHLNLVFTTNNIGSLPESLGAPELHWQALSPQHIRTAQRLELKLDHFLSAPVIETPTGTASVRDFVQACSNALGGIHFGGVRNGREEIVLEFNGAHMSFGSRPSVQALQDICYIVVRALHPLVLAIQKSSL